MISLGVTLGNPTIFKDEITIVDPIYYLSEETIDKLMPGWNNLSDSFHSMLVPKPAFIWNPGVGYYQFWRNGHIGTVPCDSGYLIIISASLVNSDFKFKSDQIPTGKKKLKWDISYTVDKESM
jgi:hypothetical protein